MSSCEAVLLVKHSAQFNPVQPAAWTGSSIDTSGGSGPFLDAGNGFRRFGPKLGKSGSWLGPATENKGLCMTQVCVGMFQRTLVTQSLEEN